MKKPLVIILAVLIVTAGIYVYNTRNKEDKGDKTKIGVIAPLSGEFSRYGDAMKWGIDLAVDDINKNGEKVTAVYQDDKFDTKTALSAFKYLTEVEGIKAIIGPAGSGISKNLAPFANKSQVVLMSSISTADTLRYAGDFYFRDVSANSDQAITIASYLAETGKKSVGIFYENNEYGKNMETVFKNIFPQKGGTIVFSESYEERQADFKNQISKIQSIKADFIFIPGTTWGIAKLVKQLRERNITTPVITGDGGYGEDITKIAGDAANGLYCTLMSVEDTTTNAYSNFKKAYVSKYKKDPDIYAIYSYDAFMMVWQAIQNVKGEITGDAIKSELYKLKYNGISGPYSFDKDGEVNKPFGLFEYNSGKYKRIK